MVLAMDFPDAQGDRVWARSLIGIPITNLWFGSVTDDLHFHMLVDGSGGVGVNVSENSLNGEFQLPWNAIETRKWIQKRFGGDVHYDMAALDVHIIPVGSDLMGYVGILPSRLVKELDNTFESPNAANRPNLLPKDAYLPGTFVHQLVLDRNVTKQDLGALYGELNAMCVKSLIGVDDSIYFAETTDRVGYFLNQAKDRKGKWYAGCSVEVAYYPDFIKGVIKSGDKVVTRKECKAI